MVPQSLSALDESEIPDDAVGSIAHSGELTALEVTSDSHARRMLAGRRVSIFGLSPD